MNIIPVRPPTTTCSPTMPDQKFTQGRARIWTINGDFVALKPTGVPRYAREVTLALDQLISQGHPLTQNLSVQIILPRPIQDLPLQEIQHRVLPEFNKPRIPQFWAQFQLPWKVRGGLISFCNLAPLFARRHIVCIHDVYSWTEPKSFSFGFRLAHRVILPGLGRLAQAVTTVSTLSRDQLVHYNVVPEHKIVVTYNGADHAMRWRSEVSKLRLGSRPFCFCIGRKEQHKNMELIWRIAPALDRLGLDVYMAGDLSESTLSSYGGDRPPNIRLLGRISDDDLAKAFHSALCFLFPSRIEGFGLPAVEAMTCGCPVVAADAPCLPEVLGEAALYARPDDAAGWITAISRLHQSPDLRRDLVGRGHVQATKYSWRGIAEIYLRLMAAADGIAPI